MGGMTAITTPSRALPAMLVQLIRSAMQIAWAYVLQVAVVAEIIDAAGITNEQLDIVGYVIAMVVVILIGRLLNWLTVKVPQLRTLFNILQTVLNGINITPGYQGQQTSNPGFPYVGEVDWSKPYAADYVGTSTPNYPRQLLDDGPADATWTSTNHPELADLGVDTDRLSEDPEAREPQQGDFMDF